MVDNMKTNVFVHSTQTPTMNELSHNVSFVPTHAEHVLFQENLRIRNLSH